MVRLVWKDRVKLETMKVNFSELTISQVKEHIARKEPSEKLIARLGNDSRKGVQKLARSMERKLVRQAELEENFQRLMEFERSYWEQGFELIAGVDEAGRGPLAGPVVAAAVILKPDFYLLELNDSKKLKDSKREELYDQIMDEALAVGVGIVDNNEIDDINILQASFKAMTKALLELKNSGNEPDFIFVDGNQSIPGLVTFQRPIVGGDGESASIAAASIIAKVTRDRMMVEYDKKYPGYDFAQNKGYGSANHIQALRKLGPTPIHRLSFAKVSDAS